MPDLETLLHDLVAGLEAAHARIAELEARHERMFRPGTVTDVDAKKQLYRQEIGLDPDGQPVKSAWRPYSQVAGDRKKHDPPSVGQQFMFISPDGDHAQGFGVPLTWSNNNPAPSQDGDAYVDKVGSKNTDTQKDGSREIKVDGCTLSMSGDTITMKAGKVIIDAECHLGGDGGLKVKRIDDSPAEKVYAT